MNTIQCVDSRIKSSRESCTLIPMCGNINSHQSSSPHYVYVPQNTIETNRVNKNGYLLLWKDLLKLILRACPFIHQKIYYKPARKATMNLSLLILLFCLFMFFSSLFHSCIRNPVCFSCRSRLFYSIRSVVLFSFILVDPFEYNFISI